MRGELRFGVRDHGAELVTQEDLPAPSETSLLEEDWPGAGQLDADRNPISRGSPTIRSMADTATSSTRLLTSYPLPR